MCGENARAQYWFGGMGGAWGGWRWWGAGGVRKGVRWGGVAEGGRCTFVGSGPRQGLCVPGQGAYPAEGPVAFESVPRIGLYAPWSGHMPEGWMRWVFDNFRIPYKTVRNEALRAGGLADWLDVLVLPEIGRAHG